MPQLYWIVPLEGGHVSNELPGGPPGHVGGGPIYHPGHPSHGLPSGPGHPSNRPPIFHPGHPDHGLPSGGYPSGQPVPPDTINPPLPADLPEPYDDKVIVAVKRPGVTEWRVTAYDVDSGIDNALPPSAQPK